MEQGSEGAGWPLRWKIVAVLAAVTMAAAVGGVVFVIRGILMSDDDLEARLAQASERQAEVVAALAGARARLAAGRLHELALRERLATVQGAATADPLPSGGAIDVMVRSVNATADASGLGPVSLLQDGSLRWGDHVVTLWRESAAPGTRFVGTWTVVVRPATGEGAPIVLARSGETIAWRRAGAIRLVPTSAPGAEPRFNVDPRVTPANGWVPE